MIVWKNKGTELYQQLPADCFESLKEVADFITSKNRF